MGAMYRVCSLQLGLNFVVRLVAEKNFYLRLMFEKTHAFAVFNDKSIQPYGCSDTSFTATVNCTNLKTEILCEIIERQIIGTQIDFLFFC